MPTKASTQPAALETIVRPWLDCIKAQVPGLELFDAHTHLGRNDPDGFKQTPQELLAMLACADAVGCFVFPMHEPDGYPPANDEVLRIAAQTPDGMFVPFCRLDPNDKPIEEAKRCIAAGARGIKLHPRAERFTLDHPAVLDVFALADEHRLPILIHAGRGIPALGEHAVKYGKAFPEARIILAHAGITDLAWIWRAAADVPNLLFDTAWGRSSDLITLLTLVPPGQILFATDPPYGHTLIGAACVLRLALQAGITDDQLRSIASGQSQRIVAGEPLQPTGPPPGEHDRASHVLLDRVAALIELAGMLLMRGADGAQEVLALALLACEVPPEIDDAPIFDAVRRLLAAHARLLVTDPETRRNHQLLMLAGTVARTPDVPVPPSGGQLPVALPDQS